MLCALARGDSDKEIAKASGLTPGTVKQYVGQIRDVLGLRYASRIALALYVQDHELPLRSESTRDEVERVRPKTTAVKRARIADLERRAGRIPPGRGRVKSRVAAVWIAFTIVGVTHAHAQTPTQIQPNQITAIMSHQLGDMNVVYTSPTVLTLCPLCSPATPAIAGGVSIAQPITVTIGNFGTGPPASGTASFWQDPISLAIMVAVDVASASTVSLVCHGCLVGACPPAAGVFYTWTFTGYPLGTSTTWDSAGGHDYRCFFCPAPRALVGGLGILLVGNVVAIDTAFIPVPVAPPTTSGSQCSPPQYSYDSTYFYFCLAINAWGRIPFSTGF